MHLIYVIETPKFGQNMIKVILKRKKFQICVELRTFDHIMPIASPSVFNLGNYFQPHFCHEVSEVHPHILAVDTISRDLFSYSLF